MNVTGYLAAATIGGLVVITLVAILTCAHMDARTGKCPDGLLNIAFTAVGALGGALTVREIEKGKEDGPKT